MTVATVAIGLATAALSLLSLGVHAQESASYQINPQHSGSTFFPQGLKLPLTELWSFTAPGDVTYPLIAENKVFFTSSLGNTVHGAVVSAVDAANGAVLWTRQFPATYYAQRAAYDTGRLFTIDADALLRALDAKTGTLLWQEQLFSGYDYVSAPVARDGVLYVAGGADGTHLTAFRESDGVILWDNIGDSWGTPTLLDDSVIVSGGCNETAFDIVSGKVKWMNAGPRNDGCFTVPTSTVYYSGILWDAGRYSPGLVGVIQRGLDGYLISEIPTDPDFYAYTEDLGFTFPPTVQGQIAAYLSDNCLSGRRLGGELVWRFYGDGTLSIPPIFVNGIVFVASDQGHLYALARDTGYLQQTIMLPSSPSDDDGDVPQGIAAGEGIVVVGHHHTVTAFSGQR